MSTTQQPTTAPVRKPDDAAKKARERAAARATPKIAEALRAGKRIPVAKLIELVAEDAAGQRLDALPDDVIGKLGDPVVENGLLVGYTPARYGKGRWVGKATGRAVRKRFDAARKAS
jgi:hypothetical protein